MIGTFVMKNPRILVEETVRSTAVGTLRISHPGRLKCISCKMCLFLAGCKPHHFLIIILKKKRWHALRSGTPNFLASFLELQDLTFVDSTLKGVDTYPAVHVIVFD